jgi:cysteine desulfurase
LQATLIAALPLAVVSGHPKRRLPSHLHIAFPDIDAERLIFALENRGVLVATGSACAANSGTRSHVLTAIGMSPRIADGSLRLTLGHSSQLQTIERVAQIIIEEVTKEMQRSGVV